MRKLIPLIAAVVLGCGGDATAPFQGLTGSYGAVRLPDDPAWLLSWPSTSTETGCAQIGSDVLTFDSPTTVTEDRGYIPADGPPVVTLTRYSGTYGLIEGSNDIVLKIDGGIDTATTGIYQGYRALVAQRRFPDYTGCGSGGPYLMLFVSNTNPPD